MSFTAARTNVWVADTCGTPSKRDDPADTVYMTPDQIRDFVVSALRSTIYCLPAPDASVDTIVPLHTGRMAMMCRSSPSQSHGIVKVSMDHIKSAIVNLKRVFAFETRSDRKLLAYDLRISPAEPAKTNQIMLLFELKAAFRGTRIKCEDSLETRLKLTREQIDAPYQYIGLHTKLLHIVDASIIQETAAEGKQEEKEEEEPVVL